MKALQMALADNISLSKKSAKTSKTINQKKEENDQIIMVPIYFEKNKLVTEITARTQRKIKRQHISTGLRDDHLGKARKIMEGLFQRHEEASKRLEKLKTEVKFNEKQILTFQPKTRKPQKYLVGGGDIVRRNEIWLAEKKRRHIQKCQQSVFEDLNRCTFSPNLVSRYESDVYLRNRSHSQSVREERKNKRPCEMVKSPLSQRKRISVIDYEAGKKEIFDKLFTLRS